MILIVSDLHLGREPDRDASILSDLVACVDALTPETVVFLGDAFDAFVETPGRIPEPVLAWSAAVRSWRERGIQIRFVMGNHDRWHRTHVLELTGQAPVRGHLVLDVAGGSVWMEHGDAGEPHGLLTRFARWFSDQWIIYRLFTLLMPFGGAQALAAHVSRKAGNPASSPATARALERHAGERLAASGADGLMMGHAHQPGVMVWEDGSWYVNTGNWYLGRTFACLDEQEVRLCEWHEGQVRTVGTADLRT